MKLGTLGTVRSEKRWRGGNSTIIMDGQNSINNKVATEEIQIVTYRYLIGMPNTGRNKLIILDASDILKACLAARMNLELETNTGPGYGT